MKRAVWQGGWWLPARRVDSLNHDPRPQGQPIDLVVLHSISLPPGEYGGDAVERLFTNRLDPSAHPYYEGLRGLRVSAHFYVRRSGRVLQFVDCGQRAWHAGASVWRAQERCNDRSIGVELEGLEGEAFEAAQYASLPVLLRALQRHYPVAEVVGHEHVAPGRKADPGSGFEWRRLGRALNWPTPASGPLLRLRTPHKPG